MVVKHTFLFILKMHAHQGADSVLCENFEFQNHGEWLISSQGIQDKNNLPKTLF